MSEIGSGYHWNSDQEGTDVKSQGSFVEEMGSELAQNLERQQKGKALREGWAGARGSWPVASVEAKEQRQVIM